MLLIIRILHIPKQWGFNRTFMELKYSDGNNSSTTFARFNRTFMELK